jgi:ribosomal protein S21
MSNYIIKITVKVNDSDNLDQAYQELEKKLETGEINLNRMEFFLEETEDGNS